MKWVVTRKYPMSGAIYSRYFNPSVVEEIDQGCTARI